MLKYLICAALFSSALAGKNDVKESPRPMPEPLKYVTLRGEDLPLYAKPKEIRALATIPPEYPRAERRAGVEGEADLLLVVDASGRISEVEVVNSVPTDSFGIAAKSCVIKWRYPVLTNGGKPIKYLVSQTIRFTCR